MSGDLGTRRRRGRGARPAAGGRSVLTGPRRRPSRRVIQRRRRIAAGATVLLVIGVALLVSSLTGGGLPALPAPGLAGPGAAGTFAVYGYQPSRSQAYIARATAGSAQVIYTKSPGGVLATAARVARFRRLIDTAVRGTAIPPAQLEGLVFLESAGRPQVIAGTSVTDAVGLTQILAGTGNQLLGMHIDVRRSARLTRQIAAALARGERRRAARLEHQRALADPRFDPAVELAATVRYLRLAEHDLGGRLDLAIAAYHAGIGNMQRVLSDYGGGIVPYVQLYFDASPARHAAAYDFLYGLGDDSSLYLWRIRGAERIMSLYRRNRGALRRLAALETAYPSNAQVLVPPSRFPGFAGPQSLAGAYASHVIVPLPRNPAALHLAYSPAIGTAAKGLHVPVALYRGLRPSALRTLLSIAAEVHALAPSGTPLIVAASVIDRRYAAAVGALDPPATTGFTFQIERRYKSGAEAKAFQFALDRLQSLNLIGWLRTPTTIEITASPEAGEVLAHGI